MAVPVMESLLQTSPGDVDARHALADALSATGQLVRADKEYATVVAADPDNVKALNSWAGVLARLGRVDESRSKLTLAAEVEQRLAIPLDIPELRQLQRGRAASR
jgi:Flp pilus assembly protein TadD